MNDALARTMAWALPCLAAAALLAGCDRKADPLAQAAQQDVAAGVPAPGIAETKTIAEEAFVYGLQPPGIAKAR